MIISVRTDGIMLPDFDLMFGVFEDYDEMIQEQFIWPQNKKTLTKLKPFIEYEREKLRINMREIWRPTTT